METAKKIRDKQRLVTGSGNVLFQPANGQTSECSAQKKAVAASSRDQCPGGSSAVLD